MESNPSPVPPRGAPPRRSLVAIGVPIIVIVLTGVVLVWSAWPTLRPVRSVRVAQAVFERTGEPVVVSEPGGSPEAPTVQAAGWLEAEPFVTAVSALADGVVETVPVLEGDRVEPGQVVATLVDDDARLALARASADLARAESEVRRAEAELAAAKTDWDRPVELERLAASSRAALAEAKAELGRLPALIDGARATLVWREEEARRVEQAYGRQAATELEVVIARQHAIASRAEVEALEAQRGVLLAVIERAASDARAAEETLELRVSDRLRLESAEAALARAEADRDSARVARDEAALRLERMTVRSPIGGYVQRRLKTPGDKAVQMMDNPHSAHIVHVYDPSRLQVRVDVPLADAAHVSVGQRCEVVVEVLPGATFEGRVLRITHEADLQKNTLQVKVAVENPSPLLKPEMLTRVRFLGAGARGGTTPSPGSASASRVRVPTEAIDESGGSPRVWIVADRRASRGVARPVAVRIEEQGETWATVTGGLSPGALLISEPADGLRPEQPVAFHEEDQNKESRS